MDNKQQNPQANAESQPQNLLDPPLVPALPQPPISANPPITTGMPQPLQTSPVNQNQLQAQIITSSSELALHDKKRSHKRRTVIFGALLLTVILLGGFGFYRWSLTQKAYGEPFETYSVNQDICKYSLKVPKSLEKIDVGKPFIVTFTNERSLPKEKKFVMAVMCGVPIAGVDLTESEKQMKQGSGPVFDMTTKDLPTVKLGKFTDVTLSNGDKALVAEGTTSKDPNVKNYFLYKFNQKQTYIVILVQGTDNYKEFPGTWKKIISGMDLGS